MAIRRTSIRDQHVEKGIRSGQADGLLQGLPSLPKQRVGSSRALPSRKWQQADIWPTWNWLIRFTTKLFKYGEGIYRGRIFTIDHGAGAIIY